MAPNNCEPDNQKRFDYAVGRGLVRTALFCGHCAIGISATLLWLTEVTFLWPFALLGWKKQTGEFPKWWFIIQDDKE